MVKETCFYCKSSAHTILKCPKDGVLVSSFLKNEWFNVKKYQGLEKRMLRRLVYILTRSLPDGSIYDPLHKKKNKNELVYMVRKLHMSAQNVKREKKMDTSEDCPVCYENLHNKSCTLMCGHKLCNTCYPMLWMQSTHSIPSCPMCRMIQDPHAQLVHHHITG